MGTHSSSVVNDSVSYIAIFGTSLGVLGAVTNLVGLMDDPWLSIEFLAVFATVSIVHCVLLCMDRKFNHDFKLTGSKSNPCRHSIGRRLATGGIGIVAILVATCLFVSARNSIFDNIEVKMHPRNDSTWDIGVDKNGEFWWYLPDFGPNIGFIEEAKEDIEMEVTRTVDPPKRGERAVMEKRSVTVEKGQRVLKSETRDLVPSALFARRVAAPDFVPQDYTGLRRFSEEVVFWMRAKKNIAFVEVESIQVKVVSFSKLPKINGGFMNDIAGTAFSHLYFLELDPSQVNSTVPATLLFEPDTIAPLPSVITRNDYPTCFRVMLFSKTPGVYEVSILANCSSEFGSKKTKNILENMKILITPFPQLQDYDISLGEGMFCRSWTDNGVTDTF